MTQPMSAPPARESTAPSSAARDDAGFRSVQRRLAALLPSDASLVDGSGVALELQQGLPGDPPRLQACAVVEGHALRALRVTGDPTVGFAAFVDGIQTTRVVAYHGGLPIVHGTVAAAVRVRHNRRLTTWARGVRVERRLYAPCALLPAAVCEALRVTADETGAAVVDTAQPGRDGERPSTHPLALLERALSFVKHDREIVEKTVAEQWCRTEGTPLFIDGNIQESEFVANAPCVAGVIKSHRTLYADGDGVRVVLGLKRGQRTSVFRVATSRRPAVASWYLRLRDPAGHDPMWGLVRVEAALSDASESPEALTARADELSRWILAEVAPIALPDGRWDKMVYPIRDCEAFLRSICH